ncbi:MAG TPA: hypothetical protein VN907_05840, partial [Actinomycetes bacterium]|nr:hypothetical protein [Actinomycetes bacterium]
MARLARPHRYRPDAPRFGLTEWEYAMCEAIYDGASPATELLVERDALSYRHCAAVPDYWCELPEDKAPTGGATLGPILALAHRAARAAHAEQVAEPQPVS